MKTQNQAALRRQNTIYELIESMRTAQRRARSSEARILRGAEPSVDAAQVRRVTGRVGVWKGGC